MKFKNTCSLEEKLWQTYCCSVLCLVALSCPTPCDPMYCSLPGSSFYGDSPGKNTGVGGHALFQGIFPTQGLNPGLPPCRWILYQLSYQGSPDKPRQHIKEQRHHFADKGPYSQTYGFSSSRVRLCELDHKEGWTPWNWCFQVAMLEKPLESPLDSKKI